MKRLVLVRHGQSEWNKVNRFTGWVDVDLTDQGRQEALSAARLLKEGGYQFDVVYTSVLKRAIRTLWVILDEMDLMWLPIHRTWRLNERHYGALQGLNKVETTQQYGEEQVHLWRRGFDVRPPALSPEDESHPAKDPRYKSLDPDELPLCESLKDTTARFLPYWHETIAPAIRQGEQVLIVAHGNSLRGLVKYLDGISDENISALNIPTGVPLVYELDDALKPLRHFYLGDPEAVNQAVRETSNQLKKN